MHETFLQHLMEKETLMILLGHAKDMQEKKPKLLLCFQKNSFEFSKLVTEICHNINVLQCSKEKIQSKKERLDKSLDSISNIPGARRFHLFKKINKNVIGLRTISADCYNWEVFDMKSGKFVTLPGTSNEQETNVSHEIEFRQVDWVEFVCERETYW